MRTIKDEISGVNKAEQFLLAASTLLTEKSIREDSLLSGWSRAHVLAHIAYNARALSRLATGARTGRALDMYESVQARNTEIEEGSRLTLRELDTFCRSEAQRLYVQWQKLTATEWNTKVRNARGDVMPASHTIWLRARELWVHALDLDGAITVKDLPHTVMHRVIKDVISMWFQRDSRYTSVLLLDTGKVLYPPQAEGKQPVELRSIVEGSLEDVFMWVTGRAAFNEDRLSRSGDFDTDGPAPRWI